MQNRAFFSVIVASYNRAELLKEAIDSVLSQSFTQFELIVVDDGSTDATATLLASYSDERLTYYLQPHCGMAGQVRNFGALQSSAPYLAFLDSDDLWHPEKLARQHAQIEATPDAESVAVFHTRELWLRDGVERSQKGLRHQRDGDILADSLIKCIIGPSTAVVKATNFWQVGGFLPNLEIAEDYDLWLKMLLHGPAKYLDQPLVTKRIYTNGGHLSQKYDEIESFRIESLERIYYAKPSMTSKQHEAFQMALGRKLALFMAGLFKRHNKDLLTLYQSKINRLFQDF